MKLNLIILDLVVIWIIIFQSEIYLYRILELEKNLRNYLIRLCCQGIHNNVKELTLAW